MAGSFTKQCLARCASWMNAARNKCLSSRQRRSRYQLTLPGGRGRACIGKSTSHHCVYDRIRRTSVRRHDDRHRHSEQPPDGNFPISTCFFRCFRFPAAEQRSHPVEGAAATDVRSADKRSPAEGGFSAGSGELERVPERLGRGPHRSAARGVRVEPRSGIELVRPDVRPAEGLRERQLHPSARRARWRSASRRSGSPTSGLCMSYSARSST